MTEIEGRASDAGTGLARLRWTLRLIAALFFIAGGANHFRSPSFYARIIPPNFPSPHVLVLISGVAEIVGGLGLLIRPLRRTAAWGLVALLVAVFPSNFYMAMHPENFADLHLPAWLFLARLPLQFVFIAWVWFAALVDHKASIASEC